MDNGLPLHAFKEEVVLHGLVAAHLVTTQPSSWIQDLKMEGGKCGNQGSGRSELLLTLLPHKHL